MKEIIDVSVSLENGMPIWPGSAGIHITRQKSIDDGDPVNNSILKCDVHVGTHIDAPLHFVPDGGGIDQLNLNDLMGPAFVVNLPDVDIISKKILEDLTIPDEVQRILFRTRNSELWEKSPHQFVKTYVGLAPDAAEWIIDNGIRLVGIDYLSIQCYDSDIDTHKILLNSGVVIVEGLNLAEVQPGLYEFICLPIKLTGSEGAPARAVLVKRCEENL